MVILIIIILATCLYIILFILLKLSDFALEHGNGSIIMEKNSMKVKKKVNEISCIKLCFSAAPLAMTLTVINMIFLMISPFIKIYATAEFINASIRLLSGEVSKTEIIFPIVLVVAAEGYSYLERSFRNIIAIRIGAKLRAKYGLMRLEKMEAIAYHNMENSEILDLLKRTENDGEIIFTVYRTMLDAIEIVTRIAAVFFAITTTSVITGILVLAVSLPLMRIAVKAGEKKYDMEKEEAAYKRRYEYFYGLLADRDSVEERTLFQYGPFVEKRLLKYYERFRKKSNTVCIQRNINVEGGSIAASLFTILIASMLLVSYFNHNMTIGLFLSLFAAVMSLTETMSWGFAGAISEITSNHQRLKDIDAFFKLSEEKRSGKTGDATVIRTIEFKNVWFKYPNTENYILKGLSLVLSAGYHYAFVGKNGAGKSTVIKLLTGLYREYEGEILINGQELKEYSLEELRQIYAIVYQDFAKYQVSVYDNISFGSPGCTKEQVDEVIRICGLENLVQRIGDVNRALGKISEGGIEVSGGEWQRIALARAFIKKNAVLILDEPTSALDSIMENKLYEEFAEICEARTTIFISHRLGSTKLADVIFVIDDGKIREFGSHGELMQNRDFYADMYNSQKRWYES